MLNLLRAIRLEMHYQRYVSERISAFAYAEQILLSFVPIPDGYRTSIMSRPEWLADLIHSYREEKNAKS